MKHKIIIGMCILILLVGCNTSDSEGFIATRGGIDIINSTGAYDCDDEINCILIEENKTNITLLLDNNSNNFVVSNFNVGIGTLSYPDDYIFSNMTNVNVMFENMTCHQVTCDCYEEFGCMAYCIECDELK